jgi:hypothetical protein
MTEFLSKNADTAIIEIKEKLYARLANLRPYIQDMEIDEYGPLDFTEAAYYNEMKFLEELLDIIERS